MKAIRKLYRRISMAGSSREISISGQVCKFYTPTPAVEEMVVLVAKEESFLQEFLRELKADDILWDIGANIGIYSMFSAGRLTGQGKVFSFEPERNNRSMLERNLKLNQINNVTPLPYALGEKDGTALLYPAATASIGKHSLIFRTDKKLKAKGHEVPLWRGDSLVKSGQIPAPTVIKLDVEGGEFKVLEGMKETLHHPALRLIQCEVHPKVLAMVGIDAGEVESLIKQGGFTITNKAQRLGDVFLIGKK